MAAFLILWRWKMTRDIILHMKEAFIKRCVMARKAKDVKISKVARDLECTSENIRKFERGQNNSLVIAYYYMKMFDVGV